MAAVIMQLISTFYAKYSTNSFSVPAKTYEKDIVCIEHRIARHKTEMSFLPNCRYHFLLLGNIEELI